MNPLRSALSLLTRSAAPAPAPEGNIPAGLAAIEKDDYQSAFQDLLPDAQRGNKICQGLIGKMYEGGKGVPQDFAEAAKWYRRAADQGYASAQVSLGALFQKGSGVILNHQEALRWYQAAAVQGHAKAMYNIGTLYENGQGVDRDLAEAARWYLESAEHGEALAAFTVAGMYQRGQGLPADARTAWAWFSIAAARGFRDAAAHRDALGPSLSSTEMEQAKLFRDQQLARPPSGCK